MKEFARDFGSLMVDIFKMLASIILPILAVVVVAIVAGALFGIPVAIVSHDPDLGLKVGVSVALVVVLVGLTSFGSNWGDV